MSLSAESLYVQLGRLVAEMPNLNLWNTPNVQQWLGRASALVDALNDSTDSAKLRTAAESLPDRMNANHHAHVIQLVVHRALAKAELIAPVSNQGAFIPAGNSFDAFAAVGKVLSTAQRDILIVDPYMDEKTLTDFAPLAAEKILVRLLADKEGHKPTLEPAVRRWTAQYHASRPIAARLTTPRALHDRLIVIDGSDIRILTQSLNAFAARSPATIIRVDSETAALKIPAYEEMWRMAIPLEAR